MTAANEARPAKAAIFQYSLGTLLLAMTWFSVVCVGLVSPSIVWSVITSSITLVALLTAWLVVIYGRGDTRAFAVGFAIFGTVYLVCLHRFDSYNPKLLSSSNMSFDWHKAMHRKLWESVSGGRTNRTNIDDVQRYTEDRKLFTETAQGASIMVFAIIGGFIARFIAIKSRSEAH